MTLQDAMDEVIRHEMPRDALDYVLDCTVKDLCASCFGEIYDVTDLVSGSQGYRVPDTIMSDSEHSTVTYTSVSEDDSDIGSPGVDGPPIMPEVPPSPDYIPGS
ncbi:hypothetical protein Tco_0891853 [Tanacetum coccineum]|uniref:Uncharacterized protein n=1 Tax=Tanacetum coccineum TaxID=301880 RepID=A0ABQ5C7F5_9ASTR